MDTFKNGCNELKMYSKVNSGMLSKTRGAAPVRMDMAVRAVLAKIHGAADGRFYQVGGGITRSDYLSPEESDQQIQVPM